MDWQPIESLPQDGESYLVCDARTADGFHHVVFWDTDHPDDWCLKIPDGSLSYNKRLFTHWMPLPEPPASDLRKLEKSQER